MTIPVIDPFNITTDSNLSFLTAALNPITVQQELAKNLPQPLQKSNLCAIRVIRHKPGRRCLIEYDLTIKNPNNSTIPITLLGKVRAKGTDLKSYQLNQTLWQKGFTDNSNDGISIPEPIAVIPDFQMWLQRKVPGVTATKLLPQPKGIPLAKRIAEAIHKLHQAKILPQRRHTIADELRILHERLPLVAQLKPQWESRLEQILAGCDRVAAMTPEPQLLGIHRDFYSDQIIVDGTRLYLLDLDLYCQGNPGLDIGNFIGHITEQSLRTLGNPEALMDRENALTERFIQLTGEALRPAIQSYTTLTLVRHIYISTQFPERCPFTETILELCEQRLAKQCVTSVGT
ncbi:MAG: aminoglycoside phosphotransferase family protein [Coleofasciculus chthonoplastes F3-SA18-01]|uniref:phosphotransferase n=1 Tax=Coleofasciculus chthonoplastes TaxID=64178 RepID=UPI00330470E0